MNKAAIVFWSGTGNTEAMADLVAQGARQAGADTHLFSCAEFDASMVDDFDTFAFGCPSMGVEELEDTEFEPLYNEVEPLLAGKKAVLFGSYGWGDGEWMETWKTRAEQAGVVIADTCIANEYPDDDASEECMRVGALLA